MKQKSKKDKRRYLTMPLVLTKKREKHNMGLVLGYIRLCRNKDETANPSHKNIAENIGMSEKTVRNLLAKAKKEGWIDWSSGQGSHNSNFYSFPASSDWLEEGYLVDQTVTFVEPSSVIAITDEESSKVKSESVKSEPSSVKSDGLIGQTDTLHRSQLLPTNIMNRVNRINKEEKIGASLQENSFKETEFSVKEKKKPKEDTDMTGKKERIDRIMRTDRPLCFGDYNKSWARGSECQVCYWNNKENKNICYDRAREDYFMKKGRYENR